MIKRKAIHPRKKQFILERDNFKCVNCGCSGDFNSLEVDHIISIVDGGSNDDSNLQTLCYRCNMKKYYKRDINNNYLLELTPLKRLELIKRHLIEYKNLTYSEFKVVFTQDELFKRLRVNLFYLEDLFREISGNKKKHNGFSNKFTKQRDICIYVLRKMNGFTYQELSNLLIKFDLTLSLPQIAKICQKFGDVEPKKVEKVEKEIKIEEKEEIKPKIDEI